MPWWKKSTVNSWSSAVKWIRFGVPVVPEVGNVTILSTSAGETHSMRGPWARTSSADVRGSRATSAGDLSSAASMPDNRSR